MLGLRGWRLFRTVKAFGRAASAAVSGLTTAAANAEAKALGLSGHAERLTAAVERLEASLARLAVLRGAASEFKRSVDGLRGAVPRK